MTIPKGLRQQYQLLAARYDQDVLPAFYPLAASFAQWALACLAAQQHYVLDDPFDLDRAYSADLTALYGLDIGTGTGVLATLLRPILAGVIGLDMSAEMLAIGQAKATTAVQWVQGDLHAPPLAPHTFRVITATFGLNASQPSSAFRQIYRLLKPGGMFIFQEWGARDPLSQAVDDVLAKFHTDETSDAEAEELLTWVEQARSWDNQIQDVDDVRTLLIKAGFRYVWAAEECYTEVPLTVSQFITYKLVWPSRWLLLRRMDNVSLVTFGNVLSQQLSNYVDDNGLVYWRPPLLRACAIR